LCLCVCVCVCVCVCMQSFDSRYVLNELLAALDTLRGGRHNTRIVVLFLSAPFVTFFFRALLCRRHSLSPSLHVT
jgi:hypothetical protein